MLHTEQHSDVLPVIDAGAGWLAVEKPRGMSVHNDPGDDVCSVLAGRMGDYPRLAATVGFDPAFGWHAVHRLDRATSGVLLVAANNAALSFLGQQFQSRQVHKSYQALVHGHLQAAIKGQGLWDWPLAKNAAGRGNPQGPEPRRSAQTRYRVIGHSAHYTHVALAPVTGRRHQLRRHAKLAGHPIVGDKRYGSNRAVKYVKQHFRFDRLALHADTLTIVLPNEQQPRTLVGRKVPATMQTLFDQDGPWVA